MVFWKYFDKQFDVIMNTFSARNHSSGSLLIVPSNKESEESVHTNDLQSIPDLHIFCLY